MDLKFLATFLVVLFIGLGHHGIEGRKIVARDEDIEFEEQLKIHNKPAIKSIKDKLTGSLFDCIDIHKQPAFDHPLLKDHKIQMQPTSIPLGFDRETSSKKKRSSELLLQVINCPDGTVPIRRTKKEDLIRAKSFFKSHSASRRHLLSTAHPGQHHAWVRSKMDKPTYLGAQASMNVINPQVTLNQSSSGRIWITSQGKNAVNSIQAGWAVEPRLYGDNKTHFFTYWRSNTESCVNLLCSGFVQVDQTTPIDTVLNTSIYDHLQEEMQILIVQDNATKNWWLRIPNHSPNFGYWPASLLPGLSKGANIVAFGGLTKGSVDGHSSPPMGFGTFAERNFEGCGYFRFMKVVSKENQLVDLADQNWKGYMDSPECYTVKYFGNEKDNGYTMQYGGPGGSNCGI